MFLIEVVGDDGSVPECLILKNYLYILSTSISNKVLSECRVYEFDTRSCFHLNGCYLAHDE